MPHRAARLLATVRRLSSSSSLILCCGVLACSRTDSSASTARVVNDTTLTRAGQEVLAAKANPAASAPGAPSSARRAPGDSVAIYYPVADSADSLDAAVQRERAALNSKARALAGADRRSRDYATRYSAFEARRDSAEALRVRRDRLRARREALHERLGGQITAPASRP
jgi:hypothetical protein